MLQQEEVEGTFDQQETQNVGRYFSMEAREATQKVRVEKPEISLKVQ